MNGFQDLWWQQTKSDHGILVLLRKQGGAACHQLHYLQMVTEKLAKAYFWRTGAPPPRNHAGFVQFLRSLGGVPQARRQLVASTLGFTLFADLQMWINSILPLAYDLERLAPALANDGPNPEYPWPHIAPTNAPVHFSFDVWNRLTGTGRGRQLIRVIELAVDRFPNYA
jgi:hypothetical protein